MDSIENNQDSILKPTEEENIINTIDTSGKNQNQINLNEENI